MSIGSRHTLSRTPRVGAYTTQLSLFLLCKTEARKRKLGVHSLSPQFLSGYCWNLSTQRPVIAATPPTQQSKNQTAPATNQGRTRLKGNQWFLEPFSDFWLCRDCLNSSTSLSKKCFISDRTSQPTMPMATAVPPMNLSASS